jgi:hypothetical protein
MVGVTIAENENSIVIMLDKHVFSHEEIDEALSVLKHTELDTSHIPEVDDEEQAEIEAILDAMTEEDKQIAFTHEVRM